MPASSSPAAIPVVSSAPKQTSYRGPRAFLSQTATPIPPAPHRAATSPAVRANWMATTTMTSTATAVKIGASGSRKKATALLVGTGWDARADGAAAGAAAGSDGSSARLMSMEVPGKRALSCVFPTRRFLISPEGQALSASTWLKARTAAAGPSG